MRAWQNTETEKSTHKKFKGDIDKSNVFQQLDLVSVDKLFVHWYLCWD